jgi:hypothetical protein
VKNRFQAFAFKFNLYRYVAELDASLAGEVDAQLRRVSEKEHANLGKEKRQMGGVFDRKENKK